MLLLLLLFTAATAFAAAACARRRRQLLLPLPLPDDGGDDVWDADGDDDGYHRDQNIRHNNLHTTGYRDGITAGQQASAQEGFNVGFKQSVRDGYRLGLVRGISGALASLPDQLKEKLTGTLENRDRIQNLYGSVQKISTNDALKMYYNSIKQTETGQFHDHSEGSSCSHATTTTYGDSGCSELDSLWKELITIIDDSSEIKVDNELREEVFG